MAGAMGAEADQPGIFEHAYLGPVQGLGLGTLRAGVGEVAQCVRIQTLETQPVMQQRQAAARSRHRCHRAAPATVGRRAANARSMSAVPPGHGCPRGVSPMLSHQKCWRLPMKSVERKILALAPGIGAATERHSWRCRANRRRRVRATRGRFGTALSRVGQQHQAHQRHTLEMP